MWNIPHLHSNHCLDWGQTIMECWKQWRNSIQEKMKGRDLSFPKLLTISKPIRTRDYKHLHSEIFNILGQLNTPTALRMRGLFQTLSGDSSNGSSPHQNNTVYVEPWIQVVKANDTAIKIVCIVSLISLAFVYLLDIFRPHFLHITKTISNFSRLKLKFRQLRSTNWVVIGLVQAVMIMSRVALYLLIHSSLLATLGISDEATNKSYPFHWLIVGCLFLMPLSSIINGFVIDYKWSLARVLLFIVVIIHIITCFTIGCFLMYANSYSKWAPVLVLVVGYIIICFCQTYTDVMLHKIVAQWYPSMYCF